MSYDIKPNLREAITSNKLVIFAGAGTSVKFNIPTWDDLITGILNNLQTDDQSMHCFKCLIENNWLTQFQVMTIIEKRYGRKILEFIKTKLKIDQNADFSLHKKITELTDKIVTTNYDDAFEKANQNLNPIYNFTELELSNLSAKESYIFKLHGDIKFLDKSVFFERQYKELYKSQPEHPSVLTLKQLFTDKTLLFIGFSLNDPYVDEIFSALTEQFKGYLGRHYIITTDRSFIKSRHSGYVDTILLENYDQLDDLITELIKIKSSIATSPPHTTSDKKLTSFIGIPFYGIIGRKTDMEKVLKKLSGQSPVVVLHGFQGVGKTSLALEVAYSCLGRSEVSYTNAVKFDFVVWISPNDNPMKARWLNIVFDSIARAMGNDKITNIHETEMKKKELEIDACLQGNKNKLLLIIDNFETINDAELLQWITHRTPNSAKVLITTSVTLYNKFAFVRLKGLTVDEGIMFMRQEIDNQIGDELDIPDQHLLDIIDVTEGNPKALELAIGSIRKQKLNLSTVKEELNMSMSMIFESLHMLSWSNISNNSKLILSLFQLFEGSNSVSKDALVRISEISIEACDEALLELTNWNLITYSPLDLRYSIHHITLRFVKLKLNTKEKYIAAWYKYYLQFVEENVIRKEPASPYWNALVSDKMRPIKNEWRSILEVMQWCDDSGQNEALIKLVMLLVHYMDSRFYNQERIKFVNRAISACAHCDLKYEEALLKIDALGWTYVEEGKFKEANNEISQGLELIEEISNDRFPCHELKALAYAWQARIMIETGKKSEAQTLIDKTKHLVIPAWIETRINMVKGDLEFKQKNFNDANKFYLKAEALTKKYGMEGHNYQINPRIGLAYLGNGELHEAEERFLSLLQNEEIAIGKLYSRYGLALVTYEKGKRAKDELVIQNAISLIEKVEQELNYRTSSNLLQRLIREFRNSRLKKRAKHSGAFI